MVIEHEIAAAVETPKADGDLFGLMALLGTYVGIVPVILGMLLLPAMRRFQPDWIRVLMAVTVGLLAFLAVDATLEGLELADESGGAFGGSRAAGAGRGPRVPGPDRRRPAPARARRRVRGRRRAAERGWR